MTELNIGLQTAVDFLKNKKSLGEIKDDANVNTKISDEQYHALVSAFKGDKDIKSEAEKMFAKKSKDKKSDKKSSKAEDLLGHRQRFKPLGKIDLDSIGKKPAQQAQPASEPKASQPAPAPAEPKPQPAAAQAQARQQRQYQRQHQNERKNLFHCFVSSLLLACEIYVKGFCERRKKGRPSLPY